MRLQSPEHNGQTSMSVNLSNDDPEIRDAKDVLATSGRLEQTTRVGDRIPSAAQTGVLPIRVTQCVAVTAAAGEFA